MVSDFPLVKAFLRAAEMHRDAATGLIGLCRGQARSTLATEAVYLSGYVVECSLKAYLLSHIPPKQHREWIEKFKKASHDLDQLVVWLVERKRKLPDRVLANYRIVRNFWTSQMRYEGSPWLLRTSGEIVEAAVRIFEWVKGG